MILDRLENRSRYAEHWDGFQQAFDFLLRPDLVKLESGRYEINGNRLFALLSKGPGRKRQDGLLEAHRKYIDIQYIIAGVDEMGWKARAACASPAAPYDPEKDIQFFTDLPDAWIAVHPGSFAIYFPEDAHLPLISDGEVHKVVVKVAVSSMPAP